MESLRKLSCQEAKRGRINRYLGAGGQYFPSPHHEPANINQSRGPPRSLYVRQSVSLCMPSHLQPTNTHQFLVRISTQPSPSPTASTASSHGASSQAMRLLRPSVHFAPPVSSMLITRVQLMSLKAAPIPALSDSPPPPLESSARTRHRS